MFEVGTELLHTGQTVDSFFGWDDEDLLLEFVGFEDDGEAVKSLGFDDGLSNFFTQTFRVVSLTFSDESCKFAEADLELDFGLLKAWPPDELSLVFQPGLTTNDPDFPLV